jgi:GAF domain-containing protein
MKLCEKNTISDGQTNSNYALCDISAIINSSDGIDEQMDRVLTEAMRAVGTSGGNGASFRNGWAAQVRTERAVRLVGKSFSDEEFSHAAAAMKTKMPVTIGDVFADNRANAAFMKAYEIRSVLAVPLMIGTGGCFFFHYTSSKETFDPGEVDFAQRTGGLVSLALRNARHAEERERLIEQMEKERGFDPCSVEGYPRRRYYCRGPSEGDSVQRTG